MAFDINTIGAKVGSLTSSAGGMLGYVIVFLLILSVLVLFFYKSFVYKYNVKIMRLRANGGWREFKTRGGFVNRKDSAPYFKIVLDRFGFKTKDILKCPEMTSISGDDRIIYIQTDVDTFVQAKETIDLSENLIKYTPVETDTKYAAVLDIQRINSALEKESPWKALTQHIGLAIIFTACVIGWYFLMKAKCPV